MAISVIFEGLKYAPEIVDVGKDIRKCVKPLEQLAPSEDKIRTATMQEIVFWLYNRQLFRVDNGSKCYITFATSNGFP